MAEVAGEVALKSDGPAVADDGAEKSPAFAPSCH